jgi:hypothetical protein
LSLGAGQKYSKQGITMNRTNITKPIKNILAHYYYTRLRTPKHWGWLGSDDTKLFESFNRLNVPVQDLHIDVQEYRDYFDRAGYATRYPNYYSWNITEKSLEHFIAQQLLELNPKDIYIDIASEGSPVPEIYHRLFGSTTYAQDLTYEPGVHGDKIGSDAASIPMPDHSVTKMALHCSFEHFEGNSDSGFIKEASRLLCVGGKIVIVPLYLSSNYAIVTDPIVSYKNSVPFERDAVVMTVQGWGNRHGRFYDAAHLVSRVLTVAKNMKFDLMRVANLKDVNEYVYARFALVGTKIDN